MAKQGMSTTLTIIVAAVVILVTALVILTIFGAGITPVGTLAEARNHCTLTNQDLCETTGTVSPTWSIRTVKVGEEIQSCQQVCGEKTGRSICNPDTSPKWQGC